MPGHELCHSTSKLIGNEKNRLKSFIVFHITPHDPIFRYVIAHREPKYGPPNNPRLTMTLL